MSSTAPHQHTEECLALFEAWRRYHAVAADDSFAPADRQAAARERDMFGRQLGALGCDPLALLDDWLRDEGPEEPR